MSKKVADLVETTTPGNDDLILISQSGVSKKIKKSNLIGSTSGLTTADVPDSVNKRYVTDAQLVVLQNTSGVNTGDGDSTDAIAFAIAL